VQGIKELQDIVGSLGLMWEMELPFFHQILTKEIFKSQLIFLDFIPMMPRRNILKIPERQIQFAVRQINCIIRAKEEFVANYVLDKIINRKISPCSITE
jgi:hypothetical protein